MQLRSSLSTTQVSASKPKAVAATRGRGRPPSRTASKDDVAVKPQDAPKDDVTVQPKDAPKAVAATRRRSSRTASKDDIAAKPQDAPKDDVTAKPKDTPKDAVQPQDVSRDDVTAEPQNSPDSKEAEAPPRRVTRSSTGKLPARKDAASKSPAAGSVQENGEYEVEKIVAKYVDVDKGQLLYCVKWLGYSKRQNTWEPLKNLSKCLDMVEEFEEMAKELEEKESTEEGRKRRVSFENNSDEEEENSSGAKKMKV